MEKSIEIIRKTREHLVTLVGSLSIEQLNKVPAGFNNNIVWNLGHLVAAQQGVCYRRAGVDMRITEGIFNAYKPESKPERFVTADEVEQLKDLLFTTIDEFEKDLNNNLFISYPAWTTRYGVEITNFEDAVNFLPFHEGLHLGYVMALKRAIQA